MPQNVVFERTKFLSLLEEEGNTWDFVVIGGGATGLGVAMDAASRGFKTILFEQSDFAKGTSSRSTKLIHGGVRYLAQGNIRLVYEALRERGLLFKNAPHLVKRQSFIIPIYNYWDYLQYTAGLKVYDLLSGRYSLGTSTLLSKKKVMELLPNVKSEGLKGGVRYFDGQFDDSRLAIDIAQTAARQGAALLNYFQVIFLVKNGEKVVGVGVEDVETGKQYRIHSKIVVNATGVFVDNILKMDVEKHEPLVRPSQGIHLVLDQNFLPGTDALMIPKTSDGRVLFAIPWYEHLLVGTTDTPLNQNSLEPVALEQEIKFILDTLETYFSRTATRKDVKSIFAGLRPLAAPSTNTNNTKEISRSHKLVVSPSGLVTITGGKWTTFRKMAEETVNISIELAGLKKVPCRTEGLKIYGQQQGSKEGSSQIIGKKRIHPDLPYSEADVLAGVRDEMARTVEDVLARRIRALFLNATAAREIAPFVAKVIAEELNFSQEWLEKQVVEFNALAENYILKS